MRLSIIFSIILISVHAYGQDSETYQKLPVDIPPSPDAAALGKFGEFPVNLSNGTPSISIPLYELKEGDITVPISISYHASGIKVSEVASSVGLGWTLMAGGAITRSVRGIPDENTNGYFETYNNPLIRIHKFNSTDPGDELNENTQEGYDILTSIANKSIDTEPDIYNFNFNGISGRFMMDGNQNPVLAQDSRIRIEPPSDFFSETWKITTQDGFTYEFGGGPGYREFTYDQAAINPDPGAVSAWYLKSISDVRGNQVTFEYSSYSYSYDMNISETKYDAYVGICPPPNQNPQVQKLHVDGIKLDKIESSLFEIFFEHSGREDLEAGQKLDSISINVKSAQEGVKRIVFDNSYFVSTGNCPGLIASDDLKKRLKLDQIRIKSPDGNTDKQIYTFAYNSETLPPRCSYQKDHWGYYNGEPNFTLVPAYDSYPGANREPNEPKSLASILERIDFPTGGYTIFNYEGHKDSDNNLVSGGARIQNIESHDGITGNPVVKKVYKYNSHRVINPVTIQDYVSSFCIPAENDPNSCQCSFYVRSSTSRMAGFGPAVTYSRVEEWLGNHGQFGKTEFYYSTAQPVGGGGSPFPARTNREWRNGLLLKQIVKDGEGHYKREVINEYSEFFEKDSVNGYVVVKTQAPTNLELQNPFSLTKFDPAFYHEYSEWFYLDRKITRSWDDNYRMTETVEEYTYDLEHYQLKQTDVLESDGNTYSSKFKYPEDYYSSSEVNSELFSMIGNNMVSIPIEQQSLYNGLPYKSTVTQFTTSPFVLPIEVYQLETIAPTLVTEETNINGKYLHTIPDTTLFDWVAKFEKYDTLTGNLTQFTNRSGMPTSLIWGYEGNRLKAKAINADADQIAYTSFEDESDKGGWTYVYATTSGPSKTGNSFYNNSVSKTGLPLGNYKVSLWAKKSGSENGTVLIAGDQTHTVSQSDWTYFEWNLTSVSNITVNTNGVDIDEVRLHPQGAQMITYTYDVGKGVTSISDENNRPQTFKYDDFNRLEAVFDHEGNQVRKLEYNYVNGN